MCDEDGNPMEGPEAAMARSAFSPTSSGIDPSGWSPQRVAEWIKSIGLGAHAPAFERHMLSGSQLAMLTDAHMIEMGIGLIGQRMKLKHHISSLQLQADEPILWSMSSVRSCAWRPPHFPSPSVFQYPTPHLTRHTPHASRCVCRQRSMRLVLQAEGQTVRAQADMSEGGLPGRVRAHPLGPRRHPAHARAQRSLHGWLAGVGSSITHFSARGFDTFNCGR